MTDPHKHSSSSDSDDDSGSLIRRYQLSIIRENEEEFPLDEFDSALPSPLSVELLIVQKDNGSIKQISLSDLQESCLSQTVVLQGASGSGKSFLAKAMLFYWATGSLPARFFTAVFYLRIEELMCIAEEINLIELLSCNCRLPSEEISRLLQTSPEKVLFIIDGFDELKLTQDVYERSTHTHPLQKAPPTVTVCALLRRCLAPASKLLVTTRSKNSLRKLLKEESQVSELLGFSPLSHVMVEKRLGNPFSRVMLRHKDPNTREIFALLAAFSSPVISCILKEKLDVAPGSVSSLETTTSIYIDFVSALLKHHSESLSQPVLTLLRRLGELAERGMLEGQVLFEKKTIIQAVSELSGNPFLSKILSKRRVFQDTFYSFTHLSFQHFFTALYYILKDEEESQRKVSDLLQAVERGWSFSSWTSIDFLKTDVEVRHGESLEAVIQFLCGLCKRELILSFFEKHQIAFSVRIEEELKSWISGCARRLQKERLLFILHCLYELHDESFTKEVLEDLITIDLSDTPLKLSDCLVLKFCLESCEHIRDMNLLLTSDHLKMLQTDLLRCKHLRLMIDHISGRILCLVSAAVKGKTLTRLNLKKFEDPRSCFSQEINACVANGEIVVSFSRLSFSSGVKVLTLTSPRSFISTIDWSRKVRNRKKIQFYIHGKVADLKELIGTPTRAEVEELLMFLQTLSDLRKVSLQLFHPKAGFVSKIQTFIEACPSLVEFSFSVEGNFMDFEKALLTQKLHFRSMGWILTTWENTVLIQTDEKTFAEKTRGGSSDSDSSICTEFSSHPSSWSLQAARVVSEAAEPFSPQLSDEDGTSSDSGSYSSSEGDLLKPFTRHERAKMRRKRFMKRKEANEMSEKQVERPRHALVSEAAEPFSPQLSDEDGHRTYRFVCAGAGRFECCLTGLVFVTEAEAEVLYRIVLWDPQLLDGLGQMNPAGPLYNIECLNGSISGLQLPHCEILSKEHKKSLAVAHFTGDNVELLDPLEVTETHVVFDVRGLSLFGLIKKIFYGSPINAQVLLFLRPRILNVHLLPNNVPVSEVQRCHQNKTYIETSSKCLLFPGREYSLRCQPEECEVQPKTEMFEYNFGPNYHPSFEVFLDVNVEEVRLGIQDTREKLKEAWSTRRISLKAPEPAVDPPTTAAAGNDFVDGFRDQLIQRACSVMPIADVLKSRRMITEDLYSQVHSAKTNHEQMRLLFKALDSGGDPVKAEFYNLLKKNEPHLVDDLESGPSRPR